jgi:hypothetical protein
MKHIKPYKNIRQVTTFISDNGLDMLDLKEIKKK